jgi:GNAT superfamily N-acetyltransferase
MTNQSRAHNPIIRAATDADLDTIVSFNIALARESEDKTLDRNTVTEGVRTGLADPARSLYFLAECDGRIAGQLMVTTEWSDWRNGFFWWIQSVYVEPDFRRCGVFRSLYNHTRTLAQERADVCGLRLYVHGANNRAMRTYERLGMTTTEYNLCEEVWSEAESNRHSDTGQ